MILHPMLKVGRWSRPLKFCYAIVAVLAIASRGDASVYQFAFSGSDANGIGSAEMKITISGNTLTLELDNTSPTTLISGSGLNAPAITGFGFDLVNSPTLTNWTMSALPYISGPPASVGLTPVVVGSMGGSGNDWVMSTFMAGVTLDYLPTLGNMADGRIYNPAVVGSVSPNGPHDIYFTTTTLVMEFNSPPELLLNLNSIAGNNNPSPYVRYQNVGNNGAGSLKLHSDLQPDDSTDDGVVPEPGTLAIWTLLIGCASTIGLYRRK